MLIEILKEIEDPGIERRKQHELIDILAIGVCAIISGAKGWEEMKEFGKSRQEWLEGFIELKNGIPSADTFRRVISKIKPVESLYWTKNKRENKGYCQKR